MRRQNNILNERIEQNLKNKTKTKHNGHKWGRVQNTGYKMLSERSENLNSIKKNQS